MSGLFDARTIWEVYSSQLLKGAVMALSFKKNALEAISFGDLVVSPNVDIESRLRLQQTKLGSASEVMEAIAVMSECFGDKAEAVAKFMKEQMSVVDLAKVQIYLIGGDEMLGKVEKKLDEVEVEKDGK